MSFHYFCLSYSKFDCFFLSVFLCTKNAKPFHLACIRKIWDFEALIRFKNNLDSNLLLLLDATKEILWWRTITSIHSIWALHKYWRHFYTSHWKSDGTFVRILISLFTIVLSVFVSLSCSPSILSEIWLVFSTFTHLIQQWFSPACHICTHPFVVWLRDR